MKKPMRLTTFITHLKMILKKHTIILKKQVKLKILAKKR